MADVDERPGDMMAVIPRLGADLDLSLDPVRTARLRRMKLIATGLLVAAAALYATTFWLLPGTPGVEWLRAASEAGMIGGLADWFAVTALFRHPLGLPIPHTALIHDAQGRDRRAARGVRHGALPHG